jgi:CheY-like chemotaxis protein
MGDYAPRHRILILEHCHECSASLARLVKALGHEVRTVRDGSDAIEVGTGFRPDVAIFHVRPFGRDGYEVARRIREQPWGTGAILIAVTGAGGSIDESRSREAGFDHHLPKPIDVGAVISLIGRSLPAQSGS